MAANIVVVVRLVRKDTIKAARIFPVAIPGTFQGLDQRPTLGFPNSHAKVRWDDSPSSSGGVRPWSRVGPASNEAKKVRPGLP